jgi:epoxyqueuosine reductase
LLPALDALLPDWAACAYADVAGHLLPCRAAAWLPARAQSVLMAVFPYRLPETLYAGRNVARFAVVPDYHRVILARLEQACDLLRTTYPAEAFVPFVDNSPIPEKHTAVHCALGVLGRHTLFVHPRWGSWVFLGCIVSTIDKSHWTRYNEAVHVPPPAACTACDHACARACPVGAIGENGVDRTRCLSFRSQRKDADRAALAAQSGVLWGCDLCQEACPLNAHTAVQPLPEFVQGAQARFDPHAPNRVWNNRGQRTEDRR